MAYYAAVVSTVEFFKEMSLSENQYPKSLFQKQQITSLYKTFSHLQELLEDYSPSDKEPAGFLDRIRDAACLAQVLIESHIPGAACRAREWIGCHASYEENFNTQLSRCIPDDVQRVKSIIELRIAEKINRSSCMVEIIHIAFLYFVSACYNSEYEAACIKRRGYEDLGKLTRQLGSITHKGFKTMVQLIEVVCSITMGKGYLDAVNLKGELNPIVRQRYHNLGLLKPELDFIVKNEFHDFNRLKKAVDSILDRGNRELERVKEAVNSIVGKGYKYLMEKGNEVVDSIVEKGYHDCERLKREVDSLGIKGYQDLVLELNAIRKMANHDLECLMCRVFGYIVGWEYQDLERVKEKVDFTVKKRYNDILEKLKEEVDSIMDKGYKITIEKVKEEVDSIVEDLTRIKEKGHTTHQDDLQVTVGASTQRPSDGTRIVGFEEGIKRIKEQIFGESSGLEVISIVGMGGIGKTTLARNIFHDKVIDNHFDFRVWVTISQNYHLGNILLVIADSLYMNKKELHGVGEGVLKQHIYQHLFGRRYLIIMDDVWDTKIWDDVKWILPSGTDGSRIVITTRQSDVASLASAFEFKNKIPILEYDQSWDLFLEKVLCPPELEDIGRSIVRNCGGLPLAIVVIAGLLSKVNTTRSDWEEVARGMSTTAAKTNEHFSKILTLSYNHLPHHLKPCFLYLGGFPEDYEVSISRLIKLWVAEGFLKPIPSKGLEEVAEEYLEELVERNLVSITKRRSNGKFRSCSIHDLLRDLCSERAYHEQFLLVQHKHRAKGHIHRFFIHPNSSSNIYMQEKDLHYFHSILSFGEKPCHFASHPSNFKPLRVLDAPYIDFTFSRDLVFELLYLRYLVILCMPSTAYQIPPSTQIPSSIFNLQHLQTFIVVSSLKETISLPSELWKMPRLEHVMSDKLDLPPNVDVGRNIHGRVPSLGALQTLSRLMDFEFNHETVQMMPSIKKLKLQYISNYKYGENAWEKFGIKNLFHLPLLETLDINMVKEQINVTPFPEIFSFPPSLKKLNLIGCMLPWEDMMVVGSLPNLQVLNLRWQSFVGEEWEPKEGEFPKLKFLLMDSLTSLKHWRAERAHFPCLEHLVIKYCHDLEGIPSEIGEFPNLRFIEVRSCNSSVKSSAREIQEEQSDVGNAILQVRIH